MANTPFVVFAQTDNLTPTPNEKPLDAGNPNPEMNTANLDGGDADHTNAVVEVEDGHKDENSIPQQQLQQPSFNMMIPFIILIGVMIAISIRTSSKEKKKREQMMNSIRKGTKIMTSGGIIGEIAEVQQDQFLLKIANNVQIVISRAAIAQVIQTGDAADDTKAEVTKK